MSDKKPCKCAEELKQVKADLDFYRDLMRTVRIKSRSDRDVGDVLFSVIRRYQKQLKEESLR
jgi:hypothetical protein